MMIRLFQIGRRHFCQANAGALKEKALKRCYEFIEIAKIARQLQAAQSDYTNFPIRLQIPHESPWPEKLRGKVYYVAEIRRNYKTGVLPDDVVAELDKLNFIWDANEHNWNLKVEALKVYKSLYGHTYVPFHFKVPEGDRTWPIDTWNMRLGNIVYKLLKEAQESKRIANQILTKPTPRQKQLIDIEFDWSKPYNNNPS